MWTILKKRRVTALVTAFVVFGLVVIVTFLMPPKYTATAEIFASYASKSESSQTSADMNSGTTYLSTQIKTYPSLVKTEAILKPVISDLNLDMTVEQLADMVTATNPTNTFMVDISVEGGDPDQSAAIANSVANNLAQQISSSLYSGDDDTSPIKLSVVQPAVVPQSPSTPKIPLYLVAGLVAVVMAVAVALIKDMVNTKIDSVDDVKEIDNGAASLGSVPKSAFMTEQAVVVSAHPASAEAEDFRRIRSNISFFTPPQAGKGHLLIFTSAEPGEGKNPEYQLARGLVRGKGDAAAGLVGPRTLAALAEDAAALARRGETSFLSEISGKERELAAFHPREAAAALRGPLAMVSAPAKKG